MTRTPVSSSSIASIGYDPRRETLHIEFSSGKVYEYAGVTPEEHAALLTAHSLGAHFSKHIRPHYDGRSVH